jgi:two-component system sensor histidine kinase VicK
MTDNPFSLPENLFQILFEKSPGSILVKTDTPRFTVLAASDAYLKITSAIRDEVLGKGFFDVFPDNNDDPFDDTTARRVFKKVIKTCKKVDIPVYRYDIFDPETNKKLPHYWSCSNIPILDKDNKVAYILNTVIDITGEVKAKEAAIESENRLLLAADATGLAIWDLYIKEVNFTYSPQFIELFGHRPGFNLNLSIVRNQVHPDDMENIVIKAYYESLLTGNFSYEIRIFWPDDSLHWVRVKGKVLFDEKKEPTRVIGTVVDATESKRDEIRKNDFIAMASHELKTPLTSLKAYIQLLAAKMTTSDDPFINNALLRAGNQVNKMTALVHSFLDLSKLEPGKILLKRQSFDICKLVEETIAESRIITNTHNIRFEPFEGINIDADREKIGQVISNLINNAIKYSPKGSTITLRCELLDNDIRIAVTDQGIGIKLKDQEKIFQRFYRVDDREMQSVSGFGIGLYLSSEIIQRHKGKIWVDSTEGKGSTFYFTLPLNT